MGLERLVVPIEWKAADDDQTLEGYASTFGNVDLGGDVVVKGAFTKSVARIKKEGIPLLADHIPSTAHVLGTIHDAKETDAGLYIKARFSSAPSAQDVRTKLLEGHLTKMSIGYETMDDSYEDRDGQRVRLLKEVKLWESSVVVFPMNPDAAISRVKTVAEELAPADRKHLVDELAELTAQIDGDIEDFPSPAGTGNAEPDEGKAAAADPAATAADEAAPPSDEDVVPGWDRFKSEAVLAGRDPEASADIAQRAGLSTRLELLEADPGLKSLLTETE